MRAVTAHRRTRVIARPGERGLTLIELLTAMAILSMVSGAIFSLLFASLKAYWKGDVATQVQQGARISVDRLTRDLQQAGQLIDGVTEVAGAATVTFNTGCATPQLSFALPHLNSVALTPTGTIFAPDAETGAMPHPGLIPYAGSYVSYYLAASSNSATPNTTGPYLIRASYDVVGNTITLATVAGNITDFALNPAGTCPTTSSREFTVQVTASQIQTSQNVSSRATVTGDVKLRNQALTY